MSSTIAVDPTNPRLIRVLAAVSVFLCFLPGGYFAGFVLSIFLSSLVFASETNRRQPGLSSAVLMALITTLLFLVVALTRILASE